MCECGDPEDQHHTNNIGKVSGSGTAYCLVCSCREFEEAQTDEEAIQEAIADVRSGDRDYLNLD